jgi:hypothetical protein
LQDNVCNSLPTCAVLLLLLLVLLVKLQQAACPAAVFAVAAAVAAVAAAAAAAAAGLARSLHLTPAGHLQHLLILGLTLLVSLLLQCPRPHLLLLLLLLSGHHPLHQALASHRHLLLLLLLLPLPLRQLLLLLSLVPAAVPLPPAAAYAAQRPLSAQPAYSHPASYLPHLASCVLAAAL